MRAYGRVYDEYGVSTWVVVSTTSSGQNDYVYLTALVQYLKLNLGESPVYGDAGIPAHASVVSQVAPDYYSLLAQQKYAPYFLSLVITKVSGATDARGVLTPTYRINATTHTGVPIEQVVPT